MIRKTIDSYNRDERRLVLIENVYTDGWNTLIDYEIKLGNVRFQYPLREIEKARALFNTLKNAPYDIINI